MNSTQRVFVVGAGLFGSVIAERFAAHGVPVVVLEKRNHIGGNCASEFEPETGIEVHSYGSHIFHTSDQTVWDYIRRFTDFNSYRHHVEIKVGEQIYPMPISLATINAFFRKAFSPAEARDFIFSELHQMEINNLEDKAISLIGNSLYQAFIKGYTEKQWGKKATELPADIITRLPVRFNYNTRYFADTYEGVPLDGYGALFKKLLADPLIEVKLNCDFMEERKNIPDDALIVYTGEIDRYFNYSCGHLEYRYVRFEKEIHNLPDYQGNSVVNYGDTSVPFTRIHEFRHYHPERAYGDKTVIYKEFSTDGSAGGEVAYPVHTVENKAVFSQYQKLAEAEKNVVFGGRLASYRYWDMDDTIAAALACFDECSKRWNFC